MAQAGLPSITLMRGFYGSINKATDFDRYLDELVPGWIHFGPLRLELGAYLGELFLIRHAGVVHIPFSGGPIGATPAWRWEHALLRRAGVRTIVLGYGADFYQYSKVDDPSLRHGLLASYPAAGRAERDISERVRYWSEHADALINGFQVEGLGRWDALPFSAVVVDTSRWTPVQSYSSADGVNGPVRVIHAPNHRGFKGTEFVVDAVTRLRDKGLLVELELIEGVPNDQVATLMGRCDILVEQLLAFGYGLTAIEGMASALPVVANLSNRQHARLFERFSYLSECPIASADADSIADVLESLVRRPALRRALGEAGRLYAEKYHSYRAAQFLFGAVYEALDSGGGQLMDLFHPLKSPYVAGPPHIDHPLTHGCVPIADPAGNT